MKKLLILFLLLIPLKLFADKTIDEAFNNLKSDNMDWNFGRALTYLLVNYNEKIERRILTDLSTKYNNLDKQTKAGYQKILIINNKLTLTENYFRLLIDNIYSDNLMEFDIFFNNSVDSFQYLNKNYEKVSKLIKNELQNAKDIQVVSFLFELIRINSSVEEAVKLINKNQVEILFQNLKSDKIQYNAELSYAILVMIDAVKNITFDINKYQDMQYKQYIEGIFSLKRLRCSSYLKNRGLKPLYGEIIISGLQYGNEFYINDGLKNLNKTYYYNNKQ